MRTLAGRTAVVTGAASGIGLGLARRLSREGAQVVLADVDEAGLRRAAAELEASGGIVLPVPTDVSRPEHLDALARRAEEAFGGVDLLCNNAAVQALETAWDQSLESWHRVVGVNLWGVVHGIRTFMPLLMRAEEGHILNTGSMGALGASALAAYTTTKHAVVGLSKALRLQLRERGSRVGVSVLMPGWVRTGILDRVPEPRDRWEAALLARLREGVAGGVSPEEVAERAVEGVLSGRFWIFTESNAADAVRHSFEEILAGHDPVRPAGQ